MRRLDWRAWRWALFPVVVFLCTRAALFAFSYVALTLTPDLLNEYVTLTLTELGSREFLRPYPMLEGLYRWDSHWFSQIAERGYWEPLTTNFFPLLPLLARATNALTGLNVRFALLLVANVASFAAYLLVYRVYLHLAGEAAARWALLLLASYPFAFFQAAAYPESLMLLCSALAVWLALRGHHIWAGVALGFGVLARHITMFTGATLLAAQLRERGATPRRFLLSPALVGLIIPWLSLGGYCLYQYYAFGDPLAFYHARSDPLWGERAWWGLRELLTTTDRDIQVYVMRSYIPFALLPTLGALLLLRQRAWHEVAAFAIVFMGVMWMIGIWGLGRYTASCWPAFLALGVWLERRPLLQGPTIAVLALFQGLYFYLFTHQFFIL
ncbi:MAG TPA: mannosyltransferase family protein [Herpetosiphonaceae bacterium]|nr:mannosyltransferase family protein [Herpetosiphonaceae bacterium]